MTIYKSSFPRTRVNIRDILWSEHSRSEFVRRRTAPASSLSSETGPRVSHWTVTDAFTGEASEIFLIHSFQLQILRLLSSGGASRFHPSQRCEGWCLCSRRIPSFFFQAWPTKKNMFLLLGPNSAWKAHNAVLVQSAGKVFVALLSVNEMCPEKKKEVLYSVQILQNLLPGKYFSDNIRPI